MASHLIKLTTKGQMTLPAAIRRRLNLKEGDYLSLTLDGDVIRLTRVHPIEPLSKNDPIWQLIGTGDSGLTNVAEEHDHYLAKAETEQWKKS